MSASIAYLPASESRHINRTRNYAIHAHRSDFKDALVQLAVLVNQLHEEHFTGSVEIHLSQGKPAMIKVVDTYMLE